MGLNVTMIKIIIVDLSALLLPPEILNQGCIGTPVPAKRSFPASDNWIALEGLEMNMQKEAQWFFWNCEQVVDDGYLLRVTKE